MAAKSKDQIQEIKLFGELSLCPSKEDLGLLNYHRGLQILRKKAMGGKNASTVKHVD